MFKTLRTAFIAMLAVAIGVFSVSANAPQGVDPPEDYLLLNLDEDISTTTVAQSGSMVVFDFSVICMDDPMTVDIWFDLLLPDGQEIGPYYIWWDVQMVPNQTCIKHCLLYISPMCMPGEYTVIGRCGDHFPLVIEDEDSFTFEKMTGQLSGGSSGQGITLPNTASGACLVMTSGQDEPALQSVSLAPQPCNPEVTLSFQLQRAGNVTATIYNIQGRKLLQQGYTQLQEGYHSMTLPTMEIPSGCYIINIEANGTSVQQRLTILK